ncbi:MAG: TlpA family protein disulfide reductase [Casimicrobiaceae bacterium]|nr:TlpA family protein disulfide reductase [Casimicrobiaceae bacterium]MCX8097917.1 TlpA family protein disulfide reductase [Casimicrobiaceae bacterium]MDW8312741.1 TlpA disulfide reductase family protein [Burkholderiales bacterium]
MSPTRRGLLFALAGLPWLASAQGKLGERVLWPTVVTVDGRRLAPSHFEGKVVLVNKFATWCPFCRVVNPKLDRFYKTHQAKGLELLFLAIDRNPADVPKYMSERGYPFPAAMWSRDWEERLGAVKGLPIIWIVGRDSRIKQIEAGELHDEDVAEFARWL